MSNSMIQQIFEDYYDQYLEMFNPDNHQLSVLNGIVTCRKPEAGVILYTCLDCGTQTVMYQSCGDRHCPVCSASKAAEWVEKQMNHLLPATYYQVVFTCPSFLKPFFKNNIKNMSNIMFEASKQTVMKICRDRRYLGGTPGTLSVLQTWSQTLSFHPHIHLLLTGLGLTDDNKLLFPKTYEDKTGAVIWIPEIKLKRTFQAIFSKLFRQKFPEEKALSGKLYSTTFHVKIEQPMDNPQYFIQYISRYISRIAISDSRIKDYSPQSGTVTFTYKDRQHGNKIAEKTVSALEFMNLFFQHLLPKGFIKIRYSGLLGNRNRKARIALCLALLETLGYLLPQSNLSPFCKPVPVCKYCKGTNFSLPLFLSYSAYLEYLSQRLIC